MQQTTAFNDTDIDAQIEQAMQEAGWTTTEQPEVLDVLEIEARAHQPVEIDTVVYMPFHDPRTMLQNFPNPFNQGVGMFEFWKEPLTVAAGERMFEQPRPDHMWLGHESTIKYLVREDSDLLVARLREPESGARFSAVIPVTEAPLTATLYALTVAQGEAPLAGIGTSVESRTDVREFWDPRHTMLGYIDQDPVSLRNVPNIDVYFGGK